MKRALVYSTNTCAFCVMAKRLLSSKGVSVDEVRIDEDSVQRDAMMQRTGRRTVPQIFIGDTHIGGFHELRALDHEGKLDALLRD